MIVCVIVYVNVSLIISKYLTRLVWSILNYIGILLQTPMKCICSLLIYKFLLLYECDIAFIKQFNKPNN